MSVFLGQVEKDYFIRKAGKNAPINQLKREVYASVIGSGTANTPFNELEKGWLQKTVSNAGLTPTEYDGDLWKQMVLAISKTPSKYKNDNKIIFYENAP